MIKMALYILEDKNLHPFLSKRIAQEISAVKALNQKRIPTRSISNISDLSTLLSDNQSVFLIPYGITPPTLKAIEFCNNNNIPVIAMHNIPEFAPEYIYSSTGSNNWILFSKIISYFKMHGKTGIAYFGINPNSKSDLVKAHHLYNMYQPFTTNDLFFIKENFSDCFSSFVDKRNEYDAVICPNDFIAVALMKKLSKIDPDYIKSHFIIGFMDSYISKLYHTSVTSVTYDIKAVLKAISTIYRTLTRDRHNFNSVNIQLPNLINVRDSTQNAPLSEGHSLYKNLSDSRPPILFPDFNDFTYENDPEMSIILQIENMFENISRIDFCIIYEILSGSTNRTISEKLFISQQTLQYHTSHMFSAINAKTKSDFINIISSYVSTANLGKFISKLA